MHGLLLICGLLVLALPVAPFSPKPNLNFRFDEIDNTQRVAPLPSTAPIYASPPTLSRRDVVNFGLGLALFPQAFLSPSLAAVDPSAVASANDALFQTSDLPRDYIRSYLQYRLPLQTSFDYLQFRLRPLLVNPETWPQVSQSFKSESARAGQSSGGTYFDRNLVNPMRIIGLAAPPDVSDPLRDLEREFDGKIFALGREISGRGGDSPVEVKKADVEKVQKLYKESTATLAKWVKTLSTSMPVTELVAPNPTSYPRSESKWNVQEKAKRACQNRGGPTLAQGWGALMVTGTVKNPCGDANDVVFFYQ